jgi:signal transduction histidine kinase
MKKSCLFIAFCLLYSTIYSQWEYFGSSTDFKVQLRDAKDDTTRLKLYVRLSNIYVFSHPDTALQYANEGLQLAQSINSPKWIAYNNLCIGQCFLVIGNYPKGIEIGLREIPVFEELHDTVGVIVGNFLASWGYKDANESSKALGYAKRALYCSESSKNISFINIALEHIASEFKALDKLDSAFIYAKRGLAYKSFGSGEDKWSGGIRTLADIFKELKQYDSALYYYKATIGPSVRLNVLIDAFDAYLGIATVYQDIGKIDSSIYYASKTLSEFLSLQYPEGKFLAASLLADNYQTYRESDSALKYLRLSLLFKDSLYSQEKIKAFQNIFFNEQMRQQELQQQRTKFANRTRTYIFIGGLLVLAVTAGLLFRNNLQKQNAKRKIEQAYDELKSTQSQLIQSEKMASLGELTAGIAHEIQNPLNFVNNFSEVNNELISELVNEVDRGNIDEVKLIASDIKENSEKINHHGKRADAIVKGMLQHSRSSSGQKEPTDINALCDEYLRLAYHGLRAKDKSFNAKFETNFDSNIGKINIIPQDIGRVILNLINNAFYAVDEKRRQMSNGFKPAVTVSTKKINGKIEIRVADNGNGIPKKILDKIFQPFFTTKPTGQGTGLGLSLSYDIVKAHGGELKVQTKEGEGSEFAIFLPSDIN